MGQADALARQANALAQNKAMAEFLNKDILEPFAAEGFKPVDVRAVFDAAAEKIETRFADYPLLEASMRFIFGNIYVHQFGDYDVALPNLERALVLQRREREGDKHLTMNYLGVAYVRAGKYREAEAMFKDLVKSIEKSHEEQATKPGPLYYAAKSHLGNTWRLLGRYDEVEPYLREATLNPWWDKGHWREQLYVGRIAQLLSDRGFYDEAEKIYDNLLRTSQSSQTAQYWSTMMNLGMLHILQGRLNDAAPLLEKALAGSRRELGDEHPLTAGIKTAMAVLRTKEGNHAEAELLFESALRNMQGRMHDDHPELLATRSYFGVLLREQHRYEEAEKLLSEVLQGQSKKLGPDHLQTLKTMYELALLYNEKGNYDKAEPLLIQAIGGQRIKLGDTHPNTLESIKKLIALYEAWNKPEKAEEWRAKLTQAENTRK
jgi:tetratricopeptide (TPR) repeat protein